MGPTAPILFFVIYGASMYLTSGLDANVQEMNATTYFTAVMAFHSQLFHV